MVRNQRPENVSDREGEYQRDRRDDVFKVGHCSLAIFSSTIFSIGENSANSNGNPLRWKSARSNTNYRIGDNQNSIGGNLDLLPSGYENPEATASDDYLGSNACWQSLTNAVATESRASMSLHHPQSRRYACLYTLDGFECRRGSFNHLVRRKPDTLAYCANSGRGRSATEELCDVVKRLFDCVNQ